MNTKADQKTIRTTLLVLILVSTLVRGLCAALIELGNDEVYYWTYALYPDWSHFDHPPMVGWLIQATSLDLLLGHEFFLRLGPVLLGTLNTWFIFILGKRVKNDLTGLIAAFMYTASIYCTVICGIFIMPDCVMLTFWLVALILLYDALTDSEASAKNRKKLILAGVVIGFAMLSKYHAAYLWLAAGAYILLYNRRWLVRWQLYAAIIISVIVFLPVICWNVQNDFISFTFHGGRVEVDAWRIDADAFFREIFGGFGYNNPVNYVLIVIALVALWRRKKYADKKSKHFLLLFSLPLIFLFWIIALFRDTLPHWSGPAFCGLILLASAYLAGRVDLNKRLIPVSVKASLALVCVVLVLAVTQIKCGAFDLGKGDPTLDMYGWKQLKTEFESFRKEKAPGVNTMVSYRWFPAAHLDRYVATPLQMKLLCIGEMDKIHKYYWINKERGGISPGEDAFYLAPENDYYDPQELYGKDFETIEELGEISPQRNGKAVKTFRVYLLGNYKGIATRP